MTRPTVVEGLVKLGVAFNREVTEALIETYWSAFRAVPSDAFADAVARAVRECQFFPVPGVLWGLIPKNDDTQVAATDATIARLRVAAARPAPTAEQFAELRRMRANNGRTS